ncbi:MAG TPA: carbon monoxide dehydrogenase subunit G [Candidatus Binatia bacterium]|nr:carbon monoxide dehydrogenase subunit G [Candidatus Binatia bacterium]
MKLEGSYTFDAPRDLLWEMFFDPEVLARTMPGCEKLEMIEENTFAGRMRIQVGPVQGIFKGKVKLSDLNEPETYHMEVDGQGPSGFMKGEGDIRLEETEEGTVMHYDGDAQVGGRIAQVGQRLMDSSARAIVKQSLDNLAKQVEARQENGQENGSTQEETRQNEAPAAPSQTEFAVGVAREMASDLLPPEKQPQIIAGAFALLATFIALQFFLDWWSGVLARKIAQNLREQEV